MGSGVQIVESIKVKSKSKSITKNISLDDEYGLRHIDIPSLNIVKASKCEVEKKKVVKYKFKDIAVWHGDTFAGMDLLESKSVDMILADLPYGTTACKWDSTLPFPRLWQSYKRIIKDNGAIVLTASQPFTWRLCASQPNLFRYELIWEKPNGTNPLTVKKQPFKVHENILIFYKKQPVYNPQKTGGHKTYTPYSNEVKTIGAVFSEKQGSNLKSMHRGNQDGTRYPRSVQKFSQDRSSHPTKKPVELFRWLIRTYSNQNDLVLDNVLGTGTTAIASMLEKRKCIGIEKERQYLDKAIKDIKSLAKRAD